MFLPFVFLVTLSVIYFCIFTLNFAGNLHSICC
uniref:Uncharacterized protein n=1 Tax=Rhizophora mucronata TaxID=61149 RepID=A0A2P2IWF1_RHIMU